MRVLQLISSGGYYGAENMLLTLVGAEPATVSRNLLAVFHNQHQPNTELYERALQRGIKAVLVPCQGRVDWRGILEIRKLIHSYGSDIIHTHGYKADLYGYVAARLEGKPVVATCHNWLSGGAALAAYNFLDRLALKRFDAVSAVSQTIAEQLLSLGLRRDRITVIPNGIDVRAFEGSAAPGRNGDSARGAQVVGVVARLDLQKGFQYLFTSVAALRRTFPALRVLIVGDGHDRARIEELVKLQNLEDVVTIAGQQSDMPRAYASFDIFVLPSLNEGLPMTLLEAMAASKPIIVTRVGAIPTVIADGETGLLIEPADAASLTSALSRLLADPELCRRLAQKAHAHVEQHYTAAAMIQKYVALYEEVLTRRSSSVSTAPALAGTKSIHQQGPESATAAPRSSGTSTKPPAP